MKQQFNFELQRFAGNTITGHIVKPSGGSVLSGNTLSFKVTSSSKVEAPKTLNDYTWAEISAISQAGTGANYFNIGDRKTITLNGTIGSLNFSNTSFDVYILHFNYPMNGMAENNIIWGGFKNTENVDIALCDERYRYYATNGAYFSINHISNYNHGGWKGCDLRYDILGATSTAPSQYHQQKDTTNVGYNATSATLTNPKVDTLLAALPSDFRNALRLWSRWIDAKGYGSNVESNIEETIDAVTLLTEFEIFGACHNANQYEQNHQTQMDYYKNENSKIKHAHTSTSSNVWWLISSPVNNNPTYICIINDTGSISAGYPIYSYGVAPAFKT